MFHRLTTAQAQFRMLPRYEYCLQAAAEVIEVLADCSQILEAGTLIKKAGRKFNRRYNNASCSESLQCHTFVGS
jgi:hypothetical protein